MFIEYDQKKSFLLPPNYKEFLGEWHEAVLLSELVEELNIDSLVEQYVQEWKWRPAFHPRMLLKVLFYGYMNQSFSSRKLAQKLTSDLGFMYIAWNNKPDFRTINRFRKEKWEVLEDIFVQIVLKAKELWLIKFGTVSLDGTKIYASASNSKNYDIEQIEKRIKSMFDEAWMIDEIEDEEYGEWDGSMVPEELKTKEWRDKRRREIADRQGELESRKATVSEEIMRKAEEGIKQKRINMTDKDARLMQMKRKDWGTWYNPQNMTENQFILVTTVPNSAWDIWELIPTIKKFHEKYGEYPEKQVADKGYGSEENYRYLEEKGIASYIPHTEAQIKIWEYTYNAERNEYKDKEWTVYVFKQNNGKWWVKWRPKKWESIDIESTTYVGMKGWKARYITINNSLHELYERNDARLYSAEWKSIYKKRSWCVEAVFWNIKTNLWFERFRLRWFKWVQIERNLISLAHNLQKLIRFQAAY